MAQRVIPLNSKMYRGHIAVKERQLLGQIAHGASLDLKPHPRDAHGPPFASEDSPEPPSTLLNGLLAYWPLQDNFGQVEIFDVNGLNPLVNATFQSYEPAKIGNGARSPVGALNGLQEQTLNAAFNLAEFTVSFWHKQNSNNNFDIYNIINKFGDDGGGNDGWRLLVSVADNVAFSLAKNGTIFGPTQVGPIIDGTMYFFVLRYRLSDTKAIINWFDEASLLAQNEATNSNYESAVTTKITLNRSAGMNMTTDELAIWNRALTDAEVTMLWNNGNGLGYPFS